MSHTYTPSATTGSVTGALSTTLPDDTTDGVAVATVNTPFQKLADVLESIRQVLVGALSQVITLLATRSSATAGAGQSVAAGAIYGDGTIRGWGYFSVTGGVITLVRGYNVAGVGTYTGVGIYSGIGLQTGNTNACPGFILPVSTSAIPIIPIAGTSAPGTAGFQIRFYDKTGAAVDPSGFFIMWLGG